MRLIVNKWIYTPTSANTRSFLPLKPDFNFLWHKSGFFVIERSHRERPCWSNQDLTQNTKRGNSWEVFLISYIQLLSFAFSRDNRVGNKVTSFKLGLCTLIDTIKIKNTPYTFMSFAFIFAVLKNITNKILFTFSSNLVNYKWHTSSFVNFLSQAFTTCGDRHWGAQPSLDAVGRKSDNPSGSQS